MIITTSYVLVINPEDENVLSFITELKQKLAAPMNVSESYPSGLNDVVNGQSTMVSNRWGGGWWEGTRVSSMDGMDGMDARVAGAKATLVV